LQRYDELDEARMGRWLDGDAFAREVFDLALDALLPAIRNLKCSRYHDIVVRELDIPVEYERLRDPDFAEDPSTPAYKEAKKVAFREVRKAAIEILKRRQSSRNDPAREEACRLFEDMRRLEKALIVAESRLVW
jgi:hypothetical protein